MKLDENFEKSKVELSLRKMGFKDIHTVKEEKLKGEADEIIYERCKLENRILVTQDSDFILYTNTYVVIVVCGIGELRTVDKQKSIQELVSTINLSIAKPAVYLASKENGEWSLDLPSLQDLEWASKKKMKKCLFNLKEMRKKGKEDLFGQNRVI